MIYKIAFICDEVEDFRREIVIDADATFLTLNKAILNACNYADDQITSFYTCDEEWRPQDQITREDMGVSSDEHDIYIMEKTVLRDFINEKGQKLEYIFDPFNDRLFYLQVLDIIVKEHQHAPQCTRSEGDAPCQIADMETYSSPIGQDDGLIGDEDSLFLDNDAFDQEDLDLEGFEIEEH